MHILMDTLANFGCNSGLKVNVSKSNLFIVGILDQDLEVILQIANFPKGVMSFKYMGIPLAAEKLRVTLYILFINKLAWYINVWTGASLFYVGRVELITDVLHGVDCFWFLILPIPSAIID